MAERGEGKGRQSRCGGKGERGKEVRGKGKRKEMGRMGGGKKKE